MKTWMGHPLKHGIVLHNLGTQELLNVSLWYIEDDGTRSSRVPAVSTINEDLIRVEAHSTGSCAGNYPITKPERFVVVVQA